MNRRIVTGVVAGVLGALAVFALVIGAYRVGEEDGRDDRAVTRVFEADGDSVENGEVVRVVDDDHHGGPRGGFFLFPLLFFGLIGLLIWTVARRGRGGPWGGPGNWGGPRGGPPWFDEWHRRAHQAEGSGTTQAVGGTGDQPGPSGPGAEPTLT